MSSSFSFFLHCIRMRATICATSGTMAHARNENRVVTQSISVLVYCLLVYQYSCLRFCRTEILSNWDSVELRFCRTEILSNWDSVELRFCRTEILSNWDSVERVHALGKSGREIIVCSSSKIKSVFFRIKDKNKVHCKCVDYCGQNDRLSISIVKVNKFDWDVVPYIERERKRASEREGRERER